MDFLRRLLTGSTVPPQFLAPLPLAGQGWGEGGASNGIELRMCHPHLLQLRCIGLSRQRERRWVA